MAAWGRYAYLRPAQVEAIRAETPLVYIPWGALEWHSYQNPIGLDGLKAQGLCEALAAATGGVVLPPVYVGTNTMKPFKGFKHTLEHRAETVRRLCRELLEQLADEDFRVIVLVTGHYGRDHVAVLKDVEASFDQAAVWVLADWEPVEGLFDGNHAARGETSYQMLFHPETVDLSLLPQERVTTLDEDGVMGEDPRKSSASFGQEQLDAFVAACVPRIQSMLAEARD
jgi:creatinine amidohydrolase